MEAEFWLTRWQQGRTGFHQNGVEPLLAKHWPTLDVVAGSSVLVPLCGKAHDLLWLAAQGLNVVGIEISPLAAQQFFDEHGLKATQETVDYGVWWRADGISILCADIFQVPASVFANCTACYDRAALVALPAAMRAAYVQAVYGALPAGSRSLLITLDYPQQQRNGPPFSVPHTEVQSLFADQQLQQLENRDILAQEPKFAQQGVTRMHTNVYMLTRPPSN